MPLRLRRIGFNGTAVCRTRSAPSVDSRHARLSYKARTTEIPRFSSSLLYAAWTERGTQQITLVMTSTVVENSYSRVYRVSVVAVNSRARG